MTDIDHEHTKYPICPHCGEEVSDEPTTDFNPFDCEDKAHETDCGACGERLMIKSSVTIRWTTEKCATEAQP